MNCDTAAILYQAIKLHFTDKKYNAITYNFKLKPKLIQSNQISILTSLSKKYKKELKYFFVSNLYENPKVWIGDLLSSSSEETYLNWKMRQQSLSRFFANDLDMLLDQTDLNSLLIPNKSYPVLFMKTMQEKNSVDTLLICDCILQFINRWNKQFKGDFVYDEYIHKYLKYRSFMNYDIKKMKYILKQKVEYYA